MLVQDANGRNVIPKSIQLVAGRTGQEFNIGKSEREDCWTQSIATGSRSFVEAVKRQMRSFAIGRRVRKKAEGFELRESQSPYKAICDTEKIDIEGKNLSCTSRSSIVP